jgi:hypothetical protein
MRSTRSRILALAAIATLAVPAAAAAKPSAKAAATAECPIFTVVLNDPEAGFTAGRYHRLNFAPRISTLTCDDTYHIFRSYLYHPRSLRGWTVGKLVGELRTATGKRFIKRGTNGRVGFDVWRFPRGVPIPRGA